MMSCLEERNIAWSYSFQGILEIIVRKKWNKCKISHIFFIFCHRTTSRSYFFHIKTKIIIRIRKTNFSVIFSFATYISSVKKKWPKKQTFIKLSKVTGIWESVRILCRVQGKSRRKQRKIRRKWLWRLYWFV